jgi:hypothetical protein
MIGLLEDPEFLILTKIHPIQRAWHIDNSHFYKIWLWPKYIQFIVVLLISVQMGPSLQLNNTEVNIV